jgi:hypothetical protein
MTLVGVWGTAFGTRQQGAHFHIASTNLPFIPITIASPQTHSTYAEKSIIHVRLVCNHAFLNLRRSSICQAVSS